MSYLSCDRSHGKLALFAKHGESGLCIGFILESTAAHGFQRYALFLCCDGEFPIRNGRKITIFYVPTADHSECRGLYPPQRVTAFASDGQGTAGIDAHKPVGFASCLGGVIEIVIRASCLEMGKSLTNGFVCKRGNPKSFKRLMAVQMVIDIAEDEFTFSPCISGYDDAVGSVEATSDSFELFECCGI